MPRYTWGELPHQTYGSSWVFRGSRRWEAKYGHGCMVMPTNCFLKRCKFQESKMKKRVVVTGGSGFVGKHLTKRLAENENYDVWPLSSKYYDLRRRNRVEAMYDELRPDIVVHLAAICGGIGANQKNPGKFFYDNLMMGMEMIDVAKERGIEKFVQTGTVCAYPKHTPSPFTEDNLWNGYPEETNAPYGIAKK